MKFTLPSLALLLALSAHADTFALVDGTYSGHEDIGNPCSIKIVHRNLPNHVAAVALFSSEVKGHVFTGLFQGGSEFDLSTGDGMEESETLQLSIEKEKPRDGIGMGNLSTYPTYLCQFEKYAPFSASDKALPILKAALEK